MIAALFVETNGIYYGLPNVEPWDKTRDARQYDGPWPVVAHPPCERWGSHWAGSPPVIAETGIRLKRGDDNGCFEAALKAVRRYGGVLEHPANSAAWTHFGLTKPPRHEGWVVADFEGGWTCCVEQGWYGHRARKATWLYVSGFVPEPIQWGRAPGKFDLISTDGAERRRQLIRRGIVARLSHRQRAATPEQFRDMLLDLAQNADIWSSSIPSYQFNALGAA